METNYNLPNEIVDVHIKSGITKANLPKHQMFLLGICAGIFIALGSAGSNVAVHTIENISMARVLSGAIFPIGLILVIFMGGELFTGNCLMTMAVLERKITVRLFLKNLLIVYFSNFFGALLINFLIIACGQLNLSDGGLGAYTIKVALGKVSLTPLNMLSSGILCNILVCLAILTATAARDVVGKIMAVFFPIWVFVISGFEHCVANMYYIPMGIMAAKNPQYLQKAEELYGITAEMASSLNFTGALGNLIPVTIGNVIGGAVFVGVMNVLIHKWDWNK